MPDSVPPPVIKVYAVIQRAVEEGAAIGVTRAYKHTDHPSREDIAASVEVEIMNALSEVVDFGD